MEPQNRWNTYYFKIYIESINLNIFYRLCKVEVSFVFIELYVAKSSKLVFIYFVLAEDDHVGGIYRNEY